ncbi:hypothetical protein HanRHA438_Chr14g0656051 [Helianthus annuus]|nr:hypothetical protein HanRHA438_Chr14g0656051 [Helianthus annuus]
MVVLLLNGVFISFFSNWHEGLLLFCCFFMIVDLSSAFDPGLSIRMRERRSFCLSFRLSRV